MRVPLPTACAKDLNKCLQEFMPTKVPYNLRRMLAKCPGHDAVPRLNRPHCPFITLHSGPCALLALAFYHAIKMLVSSFKDRKLLQTKGSRIRLTQGEKVPLQTDSLLGSVSIPATKCMNLKLLGMQRRSKDTGAGECKQYSTSI